MKKLLLFLLLFPCLLLAQRTTPIPNGQLVGPLYVGTNSLLFLNGVVLNYTVLTNLIYRMSSPSVSEVDPVWAAISNAVVSGASLGATALQPSATNNLPTWAGISNSFLRVYNAGGGKYKFLVPGEIAP